jgi:hypothetical protein
MAAIWATAVAGTLLTASDQRWFRAALAGVLVGVAAAMVWRWSTASRGVWAAASLLGLAGGIALYAAHASAESTCIAINASGRREVIGTEFTKRGRQYQDENPTETNSQILETLGKLGAEAAWTPASIQRCRLRLMFTGALWMPLFGVAAVCAAGLMRPAATRDLAVRGKKKIFISYNHEDAAVACKVRDLLLQNKLDVTIDMDSMAAGQSIQEFIEQSIREADAVVSIVSSRSLLSTWVAMETINCFHREKWIDGKLFIGCYLTEDFFRPEFRLECTCQIDARLAAIEQLLPSYAERKIDPVDLNQEKTRLYELRNQLGHILAALKGSLCLDLRDARFEESSRSLVARIKQG